VKRYHIFIAALLISFILSPITNAHAQTNLPVVRAVLFYSPTCPHCEFVINETILPMVKKYGDQLQIIGIDVTQQQGQTYFLSAIQKFKLEAAGVPFLVIDDTYLIGSVDIPEKFPGLVETYLAQGGVDWPDITGLTETLQASQNTPEPTTTATPIPVVHAVLFFRSACSHCQKLTAEVIPPLLEKYGSQLEIFGIDVSSPEGDAIYETAIDTLHIEKFGVPTLILGDQVLAGGTEIEDQFAGLLAGYLRQGGVDWPDIPGLPEVISKALDSDVAALTAVAPHPAETLQTTPAPASVSPSSPSPRAAPGPIAVQSATSSWIDTFAHDPAGNTLSVFVLVGMLGSIARVVTLFRTAHGASLNRNWAWFIPILCIIGFVVAGYLTYVESNQASAVCGPVGDCNTVQQSAYSRLFGVLPIGVLGLIGYGVIVIAWWVARHAHGRLTNFAVITLFCVTSFGTLFSIYLTFLEPFVIGATCVWCLTSAILMTILMLLMAGPAKSAFMELAPDGNLRSVGLPNGYHDDRPPKN
jgi:uncharacterized membrane protein/thiol-disulfide isomerase/thioredoxin